MHIRTMLHAEDNYVNEFNMSPTKRHVQGTIQCEMSTADSNLYIADLFVLHWRGRQIRGRPDDTLGGGMVVIEKKIV